MIQAFRHLGIVVRDMPSMLAFYCDELGLQPIVVADESGQVLDRMLGQSDVRVKTAKLAIGNRTETMLELLHFTNPTTRHAAHQGDLFVTGPTHIALTVRDLDGLYNQLTAKGIRFTTPPIPSADGKVKVTFCFDPEGNPVELVEPQPATE